MRATKECTFILPLQRGYNFYFFFEKKITIKMQLGFSEFEEINLKQLFPKQF